MELEQSLFHGGLTGTLEEELGLPGPEEAMQDLHLTTTSFHTSSLFTVDSEGVANTSLTALESTLSNAMTSGKQLPQLLPTSYFQQDPEKSAATVAQMDEDNE